MAQSLNVRPRDETVDTGIEQEATIARGLADVLADTYRLTFKTHAYHWNAAGPLFYSFHKLTETQYGEMFAAADELAERIRALGHLTPHRFAEMIELSKIEDKADLPTTGGMADDLRGDHERVSKRMRALAMLADEHRDVVTADLVTERSAFHEKAAWMLRAMTEDAR